jgi:hypothetical protein
MSSPPWIRRQSRQNIAPPRFRQDAMLESPKAFSAKKKAYGILESDADAGGHGVGLVVGAADLPIVVDVSR